MPEPEEKRPFSIARVLADEYRAIWGRPLTPSTEQGYFAAVRGKPQAALCLSGGGIRSATFCLGVMQALAAHGVLHKFHYLSTVSGGGYIGSWLQRWIEVVGDADPTDLTPEKTVEAQLAEQAKPAAPYDSLRDFTSYLTPERGLASPDTWTGIVLWARNVVINWMTFLPAMLALAAVPLLYANLIAGVQHSPFLRPVLYVVGLCALFYATLSAARALPSHRDVGRFATPPEIRTTMVWPAITWALLMPATLPGLMKNDADPPLPPVSLFDVSAMVWVYAVGAVLVAGYIVAALISYFATPAATPGEEPERRALFLFKDNFLPWVIASAAVSIVLWGGVNLPVPDGLSARQLAVFGPPYALSAHLLLSLVFVALRTHALRADLDREWLARLTALKVVPIFLLAGFAAICLYGPTLPFMVDAKLHATGDPATLAEWPSVYKWAVSIATAASGVATALLGKSDKAVFSITKEKPGLLSVDTALGIGTLLFAAGLFTLLAVLDIRMIDALSNLASWTTPFQHALAAIVVIGVGYGIGWTMGRVVNINRFSMHAVYRNRLARAYLGSARVDPTAAMKRPSVDPFTNFDPFDNARLADLAPAAGRTRMLFPVINAALNLTDDKAVRHAWAERKAAPFVFTPLACGSESLSGEAGDPAAKAGFVATGGYAGDEMETGRERSDADRDHDRDRDRARDRNRDRDREARRPEQKRGSMGVTLATAMTISGAAVSPNSGYYSSPATAFLMTLFNFRLGAWLPNPSQADAAARQMTRPQNALYTFAREMLGQANAQGEAVYLSDGGHFEDLGLYQMVRRRCRLILVVDAGEDRDFAFADLGNAIRKIENDMPVRIKFTSMPMVKPADWKPASRAWAMADIDYLGEPPGKLLYIKPCRFSGIPGDVAAYAAAHGDFPHETTVNQFFTESQFTSYRKLGFFLTEQLGDGRKQYNELADFFDAIAGKRAAAALAPVAKDDARGAAEAAC